MTSTIQEAVNLALNNALKSDYYFMASYTNKEIAEDLIQYDSCLESYTVEDLLPLIKSWVQNQGAKK